MLHDKLRLDQSVAQKTGEAQRANEALKQAQRLLKEKEQTCVDLEEKDAQLQKKCEELNQ